jgi:hypothetical protein
MSKTQHTPTPIAYHPPFKSQSGVWFRGSLRRGEEILLWTIEDKRDSEQAFIKEIVLACNSYSVLQSQNEKMRSALIAIEDHALRSDGSALVARIARGALEVPSE